MRKKLKKGTLILLDDADKAPGEQIISEEWRIMLEAKVEIAGIWKPYLNSFIVCLLMI